MDEFLHELSAELIETSPYEGYSEGTIGAIRYLSEQNLLKLRTDTKKNSLKDELIKAKEYEKIIVVGFSNFLKDWGADITLSKEEKTKNIDFLIEPISNFFRLRNKYNPEELKKLDILRSKKDTSNYILSIKFKQNSKPWEYFIRNIQILRKKTPEGKHEKHLNPYLDDHVA